MSPRISVVIPVYNGASVIEGCLEAVLQQDIPRPAYEIIVIDNGSTDLTIDIVRRYPVRLIEERVRSPYAARNTGVGVARGAILAFTDADCRPCQYWLSTAVNAIDNGADCVAGRIEHEVENPASPWEYYNTLFFLNQQWYVSMGWAATANLIVKRTVFNRVGPFQVAESGSDKAWGLRASAQGIVLCYSEAAKVCHLTRKRFGEIAAKLRRDALADGSLERQRDPTQPFLAYLMKKKRSSLQQAFRFSRACLQGPLPLKSVCLFLVGSPVLEWIRLASFYRGWTQGHQRCISKDGQTSSII